MRTAHLDNAATCTHKQRAMTTEISAVVLAVALAVSGCSNNETACSANDQCASGQACRDGECITLESMLQGDGGMLGTSSSSAGSVEGSSSMGGSSGVPVSSSSTMGASGCQFNDDNVLTADELPLALNVESRFIEARGVDGGVPVDLTGTMVDGRRRWDFSGALPGDAPATITAKPLTDYWFGEHFENGQYAVPLDGSGENFGIFRRTTEVIELLGVASREPDYTLLKYDPAVTVLRFPLSLNQQFLSEVSTSGTFENNAFYTSTDTYRMTVDAAGDVVTPAGTFPVLRVRIEQTVSIPILVWPWSLDYKYVQYSFMAACYSQVAHVASKQDEEELVFTHAASIRRLGLPQ